MSTSITAVQSTRINHGLLVRLDINSTIYRVANTYNPITWNGESYTALGHFLGISEIQEDLRATNNSLSVSLSGIPADVEGQPNWIGLMLQEPIKGSRIKIYRAFFDPDTGELLSNQVFLRFSGYVSNFSISEGNSQGEKDSVINVTLQCANINAIIERRVSGRRTNPTDFGTDTGMKEVVKISNRQFNFGQPFTATAPVDGGGGGGDFTPLESTGA